MPSRDPIAIVDIGSNSVRLVVYAGTPRIPYPIFNEKVLAGLGADLGKTGELSAGSQERALAALSRYRLLIDHMGVKRVRAVATANGDNHVAVLIPCHRVIRSDGTLGGYAGGLDKKRKLLAAEGHMPAAPELPLVE